MIRRAFMALLGSTFAAGACVASAGSHIQRDHVAWVADLLKRMKRIGPGMTRSQLAPVFRQEGGVHVAGDEVFVAKECPYFKVDVGFRLLTPGLESDGDVIASVSRPYLEFSHID
jgi:hypothetical protein